MLDYQARLRFAGDYQIFIKSAAELSEEERRQRDDPRTARQRPLDDAIDHGGSVHVAEGGGRARGGGEQEQSGEDFHHTGERTVA